MKLLILSAFLFGYIIIGSFTGETSTVEKSTLSINDSTLIVDIADTSEKRIAGLSGRDTLRDNEGMILFFDFSDFHSIWMKDMLFPIDVVWFNEEWKVVDIEKEIRPDSFPMGFYPRDPARYILEMNAGSIERIGISIGDNALLSDF